MYISPTIFLRCTPLLLLSVNGTMMVTISIEQCERTHNSRSGGQRFRIESFVSPDTHPRAPPGWSGLGPVAPHFTYLMDQQPSQDPHLISMGSMANHRGFRCYTRYNANCNPSNSTTDNSLTVIPCINQWVSWVPL